MPFNKFIRLCTYSNIYFVRHHMVHSLTEFQVKEYYKFKKEVFLEKEQNSKTTCPVIDNHPKIKKTMMGRKKNSHP